MPLQWVSSMSQNQVALGRYMEENVLNSLTATVGEIDRLKLFHRLCHAALERGAELVERTSVDRLLTIMVRQGAEAAQSSISDEAFAAYLREHVEPLQEFARDEREKGYPYLNSLAVIRIWSILESAIDDAVGQRLLRPQTYKADRVKKLKVPLAEYVAIADDDLRAEYLVDLLKRELGASFQPGVGRFEGMLDAVGLGGSVDDDVKFWLLELSQIRHALVHRNGVADTKLLEHCPSLPYSRGAKIIVNMADINAYETAAMSYVATVVRRIIPETSANLAVINQGLDVMAAQLRCYRKTARGEPAGE